jgi:hypothetical protein
MLLPHLNCEIMGSRVTAEILLVRTSHLTSFRLLATASQNMHNFLGKATPQYTGATSQATQAMRSPIRFSSTSYHTKRRQWITISSTLVSAFNSAKTSHKPKRLTTVPYTSRRSLPQNDSHSRKLKPSVIMTKPLSNQ